MERDMETRRTVIAFGLTAVSSAFAATKLPLTITSVGGYSDGVGVSQGRWTGQPMTKPSSNRFLNYYVVAAPSNALLNVDTGSTYLNP
jgi:hypothetical protein